MNWQCRKLHTIGSNRTKCKQLTTRWRERLWTRSQTQRARWRERLWTNSRTNRCRDTWAKRQTREHKWSKHTETVMVHSNPLNYYGKLWCLRTRLVCFFYSLIIESSHEQSNSPHEHEQIHNPWETMTLHNGHVSKDHVSVSRGLSLWSLCQSKHAPVSASSVWLTHQLLHGQLGVYSCFQEPRTDQLNTWNEKENNAYGDPYNPLRCVNSLRSY
jgi:hypothetical protein